MAKYIVGGIFSVIAVVVVLMWAGVIPGLNTGTATLTKAQLEVWGTVDDETIYTNLANAFTASNRGVKISYKKKSPETYEQELLRAFAAGKGPDLFQMHHTWLAKYQDILAAAPQDVFPPLDFGEKFVDAAEKDFTAGGQVYGAPLYVDTLALYYNVDLFNSAGIVFPPADWDEFTKYSRQLTKRRQSGDILISGAAMGGGKNITASSDILALLLLQYGVPLSDENGKIKFAQAGASSGQASAPEKALEFYTSFARQANPNYSWSGSSVQDAESMFAQNRVGMMIGYADLRGRLLRKSPKLNVEVAPVPQRKGSVFRRNYPEYWGFGVYKNSKNARAAWEFLKFMTTQEINEYYLTATGRPAAQKQLILRQQQDQRMKAFADQALSAVSWVQKNEQVIRDVFTEMIETQITSDQSLRQTLQDGEAKINARSKQL
ncbi:extracellular solute-binding protein [Candidatus Azambacteria bacterium]|nr:extracellular solute-binding protein [Candidatus Azambacteria bacterium]